MLIRRSYPDGVPCWIDTTRADPLATAGFYGELLGWSFVDRSPPEAPDRYLMARLDGHDVAAVASRPAGWALPAAWDTYVSVADADASAEAVRAAGGSVLVDPFQAGEAGRAAVVTDPAGAVLCLWQPGRRIGAQLVNAPGTWNWSNLVTPDPEGAARFYGAVFGWVARPVDLGGGLPPATMLQLPGYGAHLAELEPGIEERQAADGAPSGFADAVAWLTGADAADAADPAGPARWSVTFAVADTDAVVATAVRLGGTVVVPPFDAGPVRAAVVADHDGVAFEVSAYGPRPAG